MGCVVKVSASRVMCVVASLCVLMVTVSVPAFADKQEAYMGSQIYGWLASQGKIVGKSPLYNDILNPITTPLKAVADPRYDAPFIFTIGRDPYPNVASVPGGRVYVSEKTFDVIQYREELAGALCHAVAHTVRHDFASAARKVYNAQLAAGGLFMLGMVGMMGNFMGSFLNNPFSVLDFNNVNNTINGLSSVAAAAGPTVGAVGGVTAITAAQAAERNADVTGADLCAEAGLNPWGLVWLLENYQKSKMAGRMEMLSDNPGPRVSNLEAHFASAPERFAKFDRNRSHGTPMRPARASEVQSSPSPAATATEAPI